MTEQSTKKPKKVEREEEDTAMDVEEDDEKIEDSDSSDEEDEDLSDHEGLIPDDIDGLERLNFEFEAVPMNDGDVGALVNLLTQIFLRADIDCEGIAKTLISQSPFGCVYTPTEESADEDNENEVYGALSMLDLRGNENYNQEIGNFLLQKAKKFADKHVAKQIEELFVQKPDHELKKLWMLVNERMLNFSESVAGPAFNSLKDDLQKNKSIKFDWVAIISKVRMSDIDETSSSANSSATIPSQGKKKKGKAEKKRLAAARLAEAKVIYDNPEEPELFPSLVYFQYPVQSEVEKGSKFHIIARDGVTYRPYRRVCLLNKEQFYAYIDQVVNAF